MHHLGPSNGYPGGGAAGNPLANAYPGQAAIMGGAQTNRPIEPSLMHKVNVISEWTARLTVQIDSIIARFEPPRPESPSGKSEQSTIDSQLNATTINLEYMERRLEELYQRLFS